ncbi:flagellar biosynthetic protein FliO [Pseudazoarcus pumilus]|nr:flagellar biosynthetic protein FliO [Pseudazoarcus pumilus]
MPPILPFLSVTVLASVPAAAAGEAAPDLGSSLVQMVGGLAVVVALLLGSLWLIKRLSGPRGAATGLKVLGAAPVGPRERVVLVELADQILVLGVTQGSVNTLHTLPAEEFRRHAPDAPTNGGGDFQNWLAKALERRNRGG